MYLLRVCQLLDVLHSRRVLEVEGVGGPGVGAERWHGGGWDGTVLLWKEKGIGGVDDLGVVGGGSAVASQRPGRVKHRKEIDDTHQGSVWATI